MIHFQAARSRGRTRAAARDHLLALLPVRERRLELAGVSSAVLEGGDGPPIVLLHGPGGNAAHWMRVIPALVHDHRVIAPDLPGHGGTELGPAPLDAERTLAWLEALIAETCASAPTLVGELVAGAIAARFAARQRPADLHGQPRSALARLVLVDSFGLGPFQPAPELAAALRDFGADPNLETHRALWGLCAHDRPELERQLGTVWRHFEACNVEHAQKTSSQQAIAALMREFATPLSSEVLASITVPTTLIWGRHELATPLSIAEATSARHGFSLHVIDGANDAPAMEQPEAFVRALRAELARPATAAGQSAAPPPRTTPRRSPRELVDTLVIGGGQAGLATSYWLSRAGVEHVVAERRTQLGGSWHDRWDTFHLVAPNFCLRLPGMPYRGPEPDAFMPRDEVIEYVRAYAKSCSAPVRLGCPIERLAARGGFFEARGPSATFVAHNVVLATGPYQRPKLPAFAREIAPHVTQLHSNDYRCPSQLPRGGVLVVGSGQSGTQIAEELQRAGRDVHLSVSMCWSLPRRYRGQDSIWWLLQAFLNRETLGLPFPMVDELPNPGARFACNPHCSGEGGGHDIHLRQLARRGMHLYGRLESASGTKAHFSSDLAERLVFAETEFERELRPLFDAYIEAAHVTAPPDDRAAPDRFDPPTVTELDLEQAGIETVLWATGYALDFGWVDLPIFDAWGYPRHQRGVTEHPGLYVVGLPWLHSEPSATFAAVGEDAEYVVQHLARHRATKATPAAEVSAAGLSIWSLVSW